MALADHERVGKAPDLLNAGLGPFVQRAIESGEQDAHKLRRFGAATTCQSNRQVKEAGTRTGRAPAAGWIRRRGTPSSASPGSRSRP
jgi:hypothetical protein